MLVLAIAPAWTGGIGPRLAQAAPEPDTAGRTGSQASPVDPGPIGLAEIGLLWESDAPRQVPPAPHEGGVPREVVPPVPVGAVEEDLADAGGSVAPTAFGDVRVEAVRTANASTEVEAGTFSRGQRVAISAVLRNSSHSTQPRHLEFWVKPPCAVVRTGCRALTGNWALVLGANRAIRPGTQVERVSYRLTSAAALGVWEIRVVVEDGRGVEENRFESRFMVIPPVDPNARVDLRPQQSPLRDQGARGTCTVFSTMAALEAAYRRAGYDEVDLSEQFYNHFQKMYWISGAWAEWEAQGDAGAAMAENQSGAFSGGSGLLHLTYLSSGIAVPEEATMPYEPAQDRSVPDWTDAYWRSQRNTDDYNLSPDNLPRAALEAPRYYSVQSFTEICGWTANNCATKTPADLEAALRSGREVVWDFVTGAAVMRGGIWEYDPNQPDGGGHSMLIVGYDRTDGARPYFIVKNSWGTVATADENGDGQGDGWTFVAYEYAMRRGYMAGFIDEVAPPSPRPELRHIGRRDVTLDGRVGQLDVYHLPGAFQGVWDWAPQPEVDQRVGTFFDSDGRAYRVNGQLIGKSSSLVIDVDWSRPNRRWGDLGGDRYLLP